MSSKFYITTPIYYVNDKPHLGTAYSTTMTDAINRYHKLFGEECLFLTGIDEHGQKCQQAADKKGVPPQNHCDEQTVQFKNAWKEIDIQYDIFMRTTNDFHKKAVQSALQELYDNGEIYEDSYEGWYCVGDEIFLTEKELVNGKSPTGKEVIKINEKNYFFKMSKYQNALIEYIEKNPTYIQPEHRKNEVLGFLKQPLTDLCISRPKTRLSWGIEIPFDKDYVTYVWFDALLNYATAVGYKQPERAAEFKKWWHDAGATHIIGKDILTTHAVYWSTMLMALKVPLPKKIFAHGWILNKDSGKMSKSVGDVLNPTDLKNAFGLDAVRYFLVRDIHFGNDAPFSMELFVSRINTELANNLGNLLSRTTNLIEKFFDGKVPQIIEQDEDTKKLIALAVGTAEKVQNEINKMAPSYALEHVVQLMNEANRYLEVKAPWKEIKVNVPNAGSSLAVAVECLRIIAILMSPVMPIKMATLLSQIGNPAMDFESCKSWGVLKTGTPVKKGEPLFPRIQLEA